MRFIPRSFKPVLGLSAALFWAFGATPALAATVTFSNTTFIDVPNPPGSSGAAAPYPSNITVAGVLGAVTKVTVTLNDFTHGCPSNAAVILVGPQGDQVQLMMDSGDCTAANNLTFTFDDDAAAEIPDSGALSSGTFRPETGGTLSGACDPMPAPFPAGTLGSALSVFNGKDPNGTDAWSLYVCDDTMNFTGNFAGGWSIRFDYGAPGESSDILGQASADHNWTFVAAPSGDSGAVVIAGPPTYHGGDPGVVRIRNVSALGFGLRFQEWDYRARDFGDTFHAVEDISYAVLQPGRHAMSDGSIWEVGTFDLGGTGAWQGALFSAPFRSAPHLFLTVQTYNGPQAVSVRARNVMDVGFEAALFEEEALMDGHATEKVGYLAIQSPVGGGLIDDLDGVRVPYLLQAFSSDHRWVPALSQRLKLEEEQSLDTEVGHVDETLHVLALGNQVFAQQVTSNGGDTTALRRLEPTRDAPMEWGLIRGIDHIWQTLPFAKAYTDPVLVVAKPVSNRGGDPGVIRLGAVTGTHAQLRYQEWDYLDNIHGVPEDVFYLVSEAGEHSLGGLTVEADRRTSNKLGRAGQWESISFDSVFAAKPVVLASVMTYNGVDTVTTRIRNLNFSGFGLAMDEQESKSDGHVNETLAWIAIQTGSGTTADGRALQVFFDQVDHNLTPVTYSSTAHRHPTVVGDVDSTFGLDPIFLRYANPTNAQIGLKLAEEQSQDAETIHVLEDVGVFVGE